jgi:hypothetical protein
VGVRSRGRVAAGCSESRDGDWPNVATITECQPWSAPTDSTRLVMPLNYTPYMQRTNTDAWNILVVPANNNNESTNHAGERVDLDLSFIGSVDVRDVAQSLMVLYENPSARGRHLCMESTARLIDFTNKVADLYPELPVQRSLNLEKKKKLFRIHEISCSHTVLVSSSYCSHQDSGGQARVGDEG